MVHWRVRVVDDGDGIIEVTGDGFTGEDERIVIFRCTVGQCMN